MADEGFHEIQLSGKHLVALFMAATVVAVVIFLCGVMVGRDVQKQRIALAEATSEPPADPTAEARPSESPQAAAAAPSSPPASVAEKEALSYPDRLASNTTPPESLKPAPRPPAPERVSAPPRSAPEAPPARGQTGEPPGAGFAVQVAAVGERTEADTIARRLANKGYPAYVLSPAAGAPRVFRIRIGKYKDRREAEQVAARLQREEQFRPWITR
jgi:cell division septation protein DedD